MIEMYPLATFTIRRIFDTYFAAEIEPGFTPSINAVAGPGAAQPDEPRWWGRARRRLAAITARTRSGLDPADATSSSTGSS